MGLLVFNHVEWGLKQLSYREVISWVQQTHGLIGHVQNGWWLVDGLSNIFGKHRHPGWESLLNNQWNGLTDGFFELRGLILK